MNSETCQEFSFNNYVNLRFELSVTFTCKRIQFLPTFPRTTPRRYFLSYFMIP